MKKKTNNPNIEGSPPAMTYGLPASINLTVEAETATCQQIIKQDKCSALACHLHSHTRHFNFHTQAIVATWCQLNIKIKIIWQSNPIALQKTASARFCRLCAVERMIIGHNFTSASRMRKIRNLKNEMRVICSWKTRFLRFSRSD